MKARGGFTLVELLLAGAILATISFGALTGMMRISKMVNDRSELMAADGYCWDVAWAIFNDDYDMLKEAFMDRLEEKNCRAVEIKGRVPPVEYQREGSRRYEFLSHLQYGSTEASWPICYILFSNAVNSAGQKIEDGFCISVNLEWGPEGQRSILMPRQGIDMSLMKHVYNHPITIFKSKVSRSVE